MCSNDSEIFHSKGIGLFTIDDEEDSLEIGEASEDAINNNVNSNALKHNYGY